MATTLENDATFVMEAASIRHAIRNACQYGIAPQEPGLRFQASSLFLKDCRELLTSDPQGHERLHLVSGTISEDGVRVISRIVNVDMDEASPAYVRADPQDTHKKIIQLVERDGTLCTACTTATSCTARRVPDPPVSTSQIRKDFAHRLGRSHRRNFLPRWIF